MTNVASFTVLVVEDHDFQRRTILQILANLGVGSLLEAADGEAALALLDAGERPDIVVCDLDMPGMDGVELVRHMAKRHSAVAVVFASGLEDRVVVAADRTARAYGVTVLGAIPKPLSARRLLEAIGDHVPAGERPEGDGRPAPRSENGESAPLPGGEIAVRMAPIVEIGTGAVHGAEMTPGLLSSSLLRQACADQRRLAEAGLELTISAEIPSGSLTDLSLPDRWSAVAREAGGAPERLAATVGEDALLADEAVALDVLTRLRLKGFGVVLANSGGGAVTAEQLEQGPFVAVRIGASLVAAALAGGPGGRDALEASIELARAAGLPSEAAGCEDEQSWQILTSLGCDRAMGTHVAAPMPAERLAGWAEGWSAEAGR